MPFDYLQIDPMRDGTLNKGSERSEGAASTRTGGAYSTRPQASTHDKKETSQLCYCPDVPCDYLQIDPKRQGTLNKAFERSEGAASTRAGGAYSTRPQASTRFLGLISQPWSCPDVPFDYLQMNFMREGALNKASERSEGAASTRAGGAYSTRPQASTSAEKNTS